MIVQRRPWMTYVWHSHDPVPAMFRCFLYSPVRRVIPGMIRVPFPTILVNVADPDFVRGWSDATRTKINRASREAIEIRRGPHLLPDVLGLFMHTAHLRGLRGYPESHFETLPQVACAAAYADDNLICGHIWVLDYEEGRAMLYVTASGHHHAPGDRSFYGRVHYYLLWQDGLFLRQLGISILDLQGYDVSTNDPQLRGVYQWKAATHGSPEMLYHYYPAWFYLFRRIREALVR